MRKALCRQARGSPASDSHRDGACNLLDHASDGLDLATELGGIGKARIAPPVKTPVDNGISREILRKTGAGSEDLPFRVEWYCFALACLRIQHYHVVALCIVVHAIVEDEVRANGLQVLVATMEHLSKRNPHQTSLGSQPRQDQPHPRSSLIAEKAGLKVNHPLQCAACTRRCRSGTPLECRCSPCRLG